MRSTRFKTLLCFESGPMFASTAPREVVVDVRQARMLMLRVSCNWDDNGHSQTDHDDWAGARLIGSIMIKNHPIQ